MINKTLLRAYKVKNEFYNFTVEKFGNNPHNLIACLDILRDLLTNQTHKIHYKHRKSKNGYSQRIYMNALECLRSLQFIKLAYGAYQKGENFKNIFKSSSVRTKEYTARSNVFLRSKDYRQSKEEKMRRLRCKDLDQLNSWINKCDITLDNNRIFGQYKRIFYPGELYGRFHHRIIDTITKHKRSRILINGQKTIEVDYNQCHIQIIYALSGRVAPTDIYNLISENRKEAKKAFYAFAYGSSRLNAYYTMCRLFKPQNRDELIRLNELYMKLTELKIRTHHPNAIMRIESEIIARVSNELISLQIPFLSVFDSIRTLPEFEDTVAIIMNRHICADDIIQIAKDLKIKSRKKNTDIINIQNYMRLAVFSGHLPSSLIPIICNFNFACQDHEMIG